MLLEGGNGLFVGNAAGYIRLNLAMPRSIIETGLTRMVEAIRKEQEKIGNHMQTIRKYLPGMAVRLATAMPS